MELPDALRSNFDTVVGHSWSFNLHVDIQSNQTELFLKLLSSLDLKQHVDFPVHVHGHIIDLVVVSIKINPNRFFYQIESHIILQSLPISTLTWLLTKRLEND